MTFGFDPNNPTAHPEFFQPSNFVILTIQPVIRETIVKTVQPNNFVVGQLVRFNIPSGYGMNELNGQEVYVDSILSDSIFILDLDSRNYANFITNPPLPFSRQKPQVNAIGDRNYGGVFPSMFIPEDQLTTPGAFQNIS